MGFFVLSNDVTEVDKYRQQLEESQKETEIAINATNLVLWNYDVKNRLIYAYNEPLNNFDRTKPISIDEYCQFLHLDDRAPFLATINQVAYSSDNEFSIDVRISSLNANDWLYCTINGSVVERDNDGNPTRCVGFRRDNTKFVKLNNELAERNLQVEMALNLGHIIPLVWNTKSNTIEYAFPKFEIQDTSTFSDKNSISLQDMIENIHPDYREQTVKILDQLKNGIIKTSHAEVKYDSSHIFKNTFEAHCICTNTDSTGRPEQVLILLQNVTEYKTLIKDIESSKLIAEDSLSLLSDILNKLPVATFIKDADNEFRYIFVNERAKQLLQIPDSVSLTGKTDYELFPKKIADTFQEENAEAIAAKGLPVVKIKEVDWDGNIAIYENTEATLTTATGRMLVVGMIKDVSDRERSRHELQAAKEQAEKSDRLKSAFLANMSHEIRTSLNAIIGFSELLQSCEDPKDRQEYISIISNNNELLLRLINDILDLSKLESGIVELNQTQFDLALFFDEFITMVQQKMKNPDVKLITENPYSNCIITADKERMTQVWLNYVTNAIKYTPSGYIKVGYGYTDGLLKIYVEDSGIGVPEQKRSLLFQRFGKLDSFAQGAGLGLSICKAFSKLNGGEVGYEPMPQGGSRFWATKPTQAQISYKMDLESEKKAGTNKQETPTSVSLSENYHILVAEDNDSNYLLVKSILKHCTLTRAVNGQEAVVAAKSNRFDAILMDIKMPVMTGLEATRTIRAFDTTTPIIALTANVFDSDKENALNAGCSAFIPKPLKKQELLSILEHLSTNGH